MSFLSVVEYKATFGETTMRILNQTHNIEWFNGLLLITNSHSLAQFTNHIPNVNAETAEVLAILGCRKFNSHYGLGIVGHPKEEVIYCIYDDKRKEKISLKRITNQPTIREGEFNQFIATKIYEDFLNR
jgi:hypothetical protein